LVRHFDYNNPIKITNEKKKNNSPYKNLCSKISVLKMKYIWAHPIPQKNENIRSPNLFFLRNSNKAYSVRAASTTNKATYGKLWTIKSAS
jgi:hypothetical protein